MARSKKTDDRVTKSTGSAGFRGFVNHNLSAAEKADYDKWVANRSLEDAFLDVERYVDSGYKFSFKSDSYGGGVQTAVTCGNADNPDYGLCLVGRAPDLYNALQVWCFKHTVLLGGSWLDFHETSQQRSEWG